MVVCEDLANWEEVRGGAVVLVALNTRHIPLNLFLACVALVWMPLDGAVGRR